MIIIFTILGYLGTIFTLITGFSIIVQSIKKYKQNRNYIKSISGNWISFNYSYKNNKEIFSVLNWEIKYNFFRKKILCIGKSNTHKKLILKGEIKITDEICYLIAYGSLRNDILFVMLKRNYEFITNEIIRGIGLGLDYDDKALSTQVVFYKDVGKMDLLKLEKKMKIELKGKDNLELSL